MSSFILNYSLTDEDYIAFNRFVYCNRPAGRKNLFRLRILIAAAFVLFALSEFLSGNLIVGLVLIALIPVWIILIKPFYLFLLGKSILRMKKNGKLPYSSEGVITFDDSGIKDVSFGRGEALYYYSSVERVYLAPGYIYLFLSSASGVIVPVRLFNAPSDADLFTEYLKTKIPPDRFEYVKQ